MKAAPAVKTKGPEAAQAASAVAGEAGKAFSGFTKKFAFKNSYPGGFGGSVTRREAYLILGLRHLYLFIAELF